MKTTKRLIAMAAALTLTACAAAPVFTFADDPTYTVTIGSNGIVDASKHNFGVYQLFEGELNSGSTGFVGNTVAWGDSIIGKEKEFINALKAQFGGTSGISEIEALVSETSGDNVQSTAYQVAQAIEKITTPDALAKCIDSFFTSNNIAAITTTATQNTNDKTTAISGLAGGYYFIKDTTDLADSGNDAVSKFILKVAGNQIVTIKTDAPTLEKKIWHNDTNSTPTISNTEAPTSSSDLTTLGWNDVGDNQIGDTVYYYIETSVPDMSSYDTYKYIIRDTLSAGLTMVNGDITNIVYIPETGTPVELHNSTSTNSGITINMADDTSTTDTETFYINFGDLKTTLSSNGRGKIYTYYKAVLNENAKVSDSDNSTQGNPNTAWLTYSNNPNQSGSGDSNNTGDTPKDTVYDWTYTFNASKVDEKGDGLPGAVFNLKQGSNILSLVEITNSNDLKTISSMATDTKYYRLAKTGESGVTDISTETGKTKFVFVGLDDNKEYVLTEKTAPANYTKGNDVNLKISAVYSTNGTTTDMTRKINNVDGDTATIINYKGTSLPTTGGTGTKVLYAIGGTILVGAGMVLVSKKRAQK